MTVKTETSEGRRLKCEVCGAECTALLHFDDGDIDNGDVCLDCLNEAVAMLEEART